MLQIKWVSWVHTEASRNRSLLVSCWEGGICDSLRPVDTSTEIKWVRSWDCAIAFSISHTRGRCCYSSSSRGAACLTASLDPRNKLVRQHSDLELNQDTFIFMRGRKYRGNLKVFMCLELTVMQLETKDPHRALIALYHSYKTHIKEVKEESLGTTNRQADLGEHMNYDQGLVPSRRHKRAGGQSFPRGLLTVSHSYRWAQLELSEWGDMKWILL